MSRAGLAPCWATVVVGMAVVPSGAAAASVLVAAAAAAALGVGLTGWSNWLWATSGTRLDRPKLVRPYNALTSDATMHPDNSGARVRLRVARMESRDVHSGDNLGDWPAR